MNYGLGVWAPVRDVIPSWIKGIPGSKLDLETGVKISCRRALFLFHRQGGVLRVDVIG